MGSFIPGHDPSPIRQRRRLLLGGLALVLCLVPPLASASDGTLRLEGSIGVGTLELTGPATWSGQPRLVSFPMAKAKVEQNATFTFEAREVHASQAGHPGRYYGMPPNAAGTLGAGTFSAGWTYHNLSLGPTKGSSLRTTGFYSYWLAEWAPAAGADFGVGSEGLDLGILPRLDLPTEPTPPKTSGTSRTSPGTPEPRHADLHRDGAAIVLQGKPHAPLTLRGDFRLTLFDADLRLESGGSRHDLDSGYVRTNPVGATPATPDGAVHDVEERFLRLDLVGANLTILPAGRAYVLAAASVSVQSDSELQLTDARGHLRIAAEGTELAGVSVWIRPLDLSTKLVPDASSSPPRGTVSLTGTASSVRTADRVFAPENVRQGEAARSWTVLVAILALVAALGAGGALLRRRRRARFETLVELAARGAHEQVLKQAGPFTRSRHYAVDASSLQVDALLQLARPHEARILLEGAAHWPKAAQPLRDLLAARIAHACGEEAAARRHLEDCLTSAPEYAHEVRANPAYAWALTVRPIVRLLGAAGAADPEGYA